MQFIDINNNNNNKTLTIEEEEQFFKKKNNCGIIYFYEPEHLFGFLSNFYPSPFIASTTATSSTTDNNFNNNNNNTSTTTTTEIIEWKTSEHFYQAHKFTQNKEIFNEIQTSSTPKEAFELSRKYQFKIDNNNNNEWNDERKEKIMMEALINKFLYSKNKELLNRLIQLKGFYLVENSFVDSYWGIGSDGKGKNRLGILLMKLIENVVNK